MENHHFQWENQLQMAILDSYVTLPEGNISSTKSSRPSTDSLHFSKLACPDLADVGMKLATFGRMNMKTKGISAKSGWWFLVTGRFQLIEPDALI